MRAENDRGESVISRDEPDRAVSSVVTYAMALGITTVLIAALLAGTTAHLESERERAAEVELETIGERLALEITVVDRASTSEAASNRVVQESTYPSTVAGSAYRFEVVGDCHRLEAALTTGERCLEVAATAIDATAYVPLGDAGSAVETDGPVRGGEIRIVFEGDRLEVRNR